jgi:hypothetical protein
MGLLPLGRPERRGASGPYDESESLYSTTVWGLFIHSFIHSFIPCMIHLHGDYLVVPFIRSLDHQGRCVPKLWW